MPSSENGGSSAVVLNLGCTLESPRNSQNTDSTPHILFDWAKEWPGHLGFIEVLQETLNVQPSLTTTSLALVSWLFNVNILKYHLGLV